MSLDDRIRTSVDAALTELSARVDKDLRALVDQLITVALEERDEALIVARRAALDEAQADTQQQIEEAEARVRATIDEAVTEARADERTKTAIEVRKLVEAEAEQKMHEAAAAADARMKMALADADAKATTALHQSVNEARVREREAEMAAVTRLLESIRGLDGATSLSEVLDALGQAAGREASRAAVLVLRNERLLGWKLSGFGARDAQPKGIDLGLNDSGVIGLAVGTARPVTTRDSQTAAEGPIFAHLPADRMGFAVPVIVAGRVVAVVYADSMSEGKEHAVPSGWPEIIEVLARHAARCLEALAAQKAVSPPSPRFWVPTSGKQQPPGSSQQSNTASDASSPPSPSGRPPGVNA
jgi:hypothetical protein